MSVFTNKLSALKQTINNYISNGIIDSNDKYIINAINKYKSTHDKYKSNVPLNDYYNSIIQKIDKKIQVIQQQQQNKQAYLHYVNNDVNAAQFSHNDESTYNITSLNEVLNNFNSNYNYTEDLYLDESNIFFDIDYEEVKNQSVKDQSVKDQLNQTETIDFSNIDLEFREAAILEQQTMEEDKQLELQGNNPINIEMFNKLRAMLNSIYDIYDELVKFTSQQIYILGTIEYKSNNPRVDEIINKMKSSDIFKNILYYENNSELVKDISGHIFINCCADRDLLRDYMITHAVKSNYYNKPSPFDASVYVGKGDRQALRCSFSPKIIKGEYIRPISQELINDVSKFKVNYSMCSMAPHQYSINITEQLKEYLAKNKLVPKVELKNNIQKKDKKNTKQDKNQYQIQDDYPSIFKYINCKNEIANISDLVFMNGINNFDLGGLLYPYSSLPLTQSEFENEIMNIKLVENDVFTNEINKQFLSKCYQSIQYYQDVKNIQPLFLLKKYTFQHMDDYKANCKESKIEPDPAIIEEHENTIESINYYIDKYSKISFASHHDSFYDITNTRQGRKESKIIYNIYGIIGGNYIEPRIGKRFRSMNELKQYYRLSGSSAKYVEESITYFESEIEYERYITEYEYLKLNEQQRNKLIDDVKQLLEILQTSFYEYNDFIYYIGFLIAKLKMKTTLNKGILNQPKRNCGSGKDSLKTFITDLLDSYLNIMCPNVENINKPLNGAYFKSDLIVFQEIPRNIKDLENFINRLKENTCVKYLTVEEKGINGYKTKNKTDFIINTNHEMSALFYNKNDCEALLKRFKIIERKTINMTSAQVNIILDEFGHMRNTYVNELLHSHMFYLYLIGEIENGKEFSEECLNYFMNHKDDKNEIENIYRTSSVNVNDTDTIITNYNLPQFMGDFKAKYVDTHKRIRIKALIEMLMYNIKEYKEYKKPDTVKHSLMINKLITYDENIKKYTMTDDQIKDFYLKYYTYEEPDNSIQFQIQSLEQ